MIRTELLRSLIDTAGTGLEMGPSYNPLLPKAQGFRVEVADYLDADQLRRKYKGNTGVDPKNIELVDHVLDESRSLSEQIGRRECYDYIVASHVIEHMPDMLGFLQSCETLLKPDGVLLLAVPDRRHCFDVLQPLASTGMILQANLEGRRKPTAGALFDDRAYNVLRGGEIGWMPEDGRPLSFAASLGAAKSDYRAAAAGLLGYVDVHVWRFVPSSFRLILHDLAEIEEIRLREKYFHDSVGNEFYVTLSASGPGCGVERLTLAQQMLRECARVQG